MQPSQVQEVKTNINQHKRVRRFNEIAKNYLGIMFAFEMKGPNFIFQNDRPYISV